MKKLFFTFAVLAIIVSGCSEIEDILNNLEQEVDEIRNTPIATLQEQD